MPFPSTVVVSQNLTLGEIELKGCVDRALDKMGPRLKYTVYMKLGEIRAAKGIKSGGLLENPELLSASLSSIFGRGAKNVESRIVSEIKLFLGGLIPGANDLVSVVRIAQQAGARNALTPVSVIAELFPY
jgi:hypothetical protein